MDAESVAGAVLAASAAGTPDDERAAANQYILQVHESDDAVDIGGQLLSHTEEVVRQFGLELLDSTVAFSWASLSPTQQNMLKEMAIALISGTHSHTLHVHVYIHVYIHM